MMFKFSSLLVLAIILVTISAQQPFDLCPCGSAPQCPPCILAKAVKDLHSNNEKDAIADAATQQQLAEESELQNKLFQQANKYATEAADLEKQAQEQAILIQELASKAQIARNKLQRAENQAKQLAMKALNTMTIHPPHAVTGTPELQMQQVGVARQTVTQNSPSYALTIGTTDPSGFHDMIGSEINEAVGLSNEAQAPDNENEAILSNEEAGSSYMEQ